MSGQGAGNFPQFLSGGPNQAFHGQAIAGGVLGQGGQSYGLGGLSGSGLHADQSQLMQQNQTNMNQSLVQSLDNVLVQDQFKFFVEQY